MKRENVQRLAACLVVATLAFPFTGASAAGVDATPLDVTMGDRGGWVSYRLTVPAGETLGIHMEAEGLDRMHQHGFRLFASSGDPYAGVVATALRQESGVHVDEEVTPGARVHHEVRHPDGPGGAYALTATLEGVKADTYGLLVWTAGNATRWTLALDASDGVTLDARDAGDGAHLFTSRDFHADARAEALVVNAGARSIRGGVLDLDVENVLFGGYRGLSGPVGYANDEMRLTTPTGEALDCPCRFRDLTGEDALPPGTYRFTLDGVRAGWNQEAFAWVVDARLPS